MRLTRLRSSPQRSLVNEDDTEKQQGGNSGRCRQSDGNIPRSRPVNSAEHEAVCALFRRERNTERISRTLPLAAPDCFAPFVPAPPRVHNTIGVEVERAHLLWDIIQNLEDEDTFYETRTMQFRVRENDALHKAFKDAREEGV